MNDANWNNRHHISPSLFNSKNHKYYKVSDKNLSITQNADAHPPWNQIINMRYFFQMYFDKDFKNKQQVMINP